MTALDIDDPDIPDPDLDAWADWEQWCETNGAIPADGLEPSDQDALVHADRILGRLARVTRAAQADEYIAEQQRAQIGRWLDARMAVHRGQESFLRSVLERFHRAVLDGDASRKTIDLPAGRLTARRLPAQWMVDDELFVAWAVEQSPDLVRVRTTPDRRKLKEALTVRDGVAVDASSGEVVPGVTVEEGAVKFNVEVSSE